MGSQAFNAADLDSPGYEYLRSYKAMSDLHFKLVALDYQKEFCPLYKCPPVHKFYFALASPNQVEQQFSFMCLCVWLIKDKCQMNFDTDPREYQDLDSTVSVIYEALKLLLSSNELKQQDGGGSQLFPIGRLKQGYGPEVVYCLNRFADRALELALEDNPKLGMQPEIVYCSKQKRGGGGGGSSGPVNSIIIGEPIVGGGLTTRPLGNYQIDDSSLIFDYESSAESNGATTNETLVVHNSEWAQEKLDKIAPLFDETQLYDDENDKISLAVQPSRWSNMLQSVRQARLEVSEFSRDFKPALEMVCVRVERQLQIIGSREMTLNNSLRAQLETFLQANRKHKELFRRNVELSERINHRTDTFEHYLEQLKELRTKEVKLNDESKLVELERLTEKLTDQTQAMDLKLGLLLAASCRTGSSAS